MVKNIKPYLALFTLVLIASISLIAAAGVATPYWDNNPLKLAKGESTIVSLGLQNNVGNEDLTFQATVSQQGTVARLLGNSNEFTVPLGSNIPVDLEITVPENAVVGDIHEIRISFKQVSSNQGGLVSVASGFTTEIPVQVVGETDSVLYEPETEQESQDLSLIAIILVVIALGIIVFMLARKRKN